MRRPLTVYAIRVDGVIRYIGQSVNPKDRLKQHFSDARGRGGKTLFLRKLRSALARGADIQITALHDGLSEDEANDIEIAEIASRGGHQTAGALLWNTHKGGAGGSSPASREVLRKRWAEDSEFRAKQSARARATLSQSRSSPEFEAKRVARTVEFAKSPEGQAQLRKARRSIDRDKQKAAASATFKRLWADPKYRAERLAGLARGRAKRWGTQCVSH